MNPLSQAFAGLFSGIAQSAGATAAKAAAANPVVQDALGQVEAQIASAKKAAYIASAVAGVVVLFYFVPRFESPIPRVWRKRR